MSRKPKTPKYGNYRVVVISKVKGYPEARPETMTFEDAESTVLRTTARGPVAWVETLEGRFVPSKGVSKKPWEGETVEWGKKPSKRVRLDIGKHRARVGLPPRDETERLAAQIVKGEKKVARIMEDPVGRKLLEGEMPKKAPTVRGKTQKAILAYVQGLGSRSAQLTDMAAHPSFRGTHLSAIQRSAKALAKRGFVRLDGSKISAGDVLKEMSEHPWATPAQAQRIAADHRKKETMNATDRGRVRRYEDLVGYAKADYMKAQDSAVSEVGRSPETAKAWKRVAQYVDATTANRGIREGYQMAIDNLRAFKETPRFNLSGKRSDEHRSATADRLMPYQVQYRKSPKGRWGIWNTGASITQAQRDADTLFRDGPHYGVRVYHSAKDAVVYVPGNKPAKKKKPARSTRRKKRIARGTKKSARKAKSCPPAATPKRCGKLLGKRGGKASARAAKKRAKKRSSKEKLTMDEQIALARKALK
jgi:hypothetical protein